MHGEAVPLPIPAGACARSRPRLRAPASRSRAFAVGAREPACRPVRDASVAGTSTGARSAPRRARLSTASACRSIPSARIRDLPQVERALVAIVRAFEDIGRRQDRDKPGVLVLDEPTPFLPRAGVDQLFSLVRGIVREGTSVIFVSHDVDEVMEITDRATVLRDGNLAGTLETRRVDTGRFRRADHRPAGEALPERAARSRYGTGRGRGSRAVSGEHRRATYRSIFARGEIVGLTGLIGSGSDEHRLSHLRRREGAARHDRDRRQATRRRGDDRRPRRSIGGHRAPPRRSARRAAGIGPLSIADNITLARPGDFRGTLGLDWSRYRDHAGTLCRGLRGAARTSRR